MIAFNTENVGIGTQYPTAKLEVSRSSQPQINISQTDYTVNPGSDTNIGVIQFRNDGASSQVDKFCEIKATVRAGNYEPSLTFWTKPAWNIPAQYTSYMRMIITENGQIGIGTNNPLSALHITAQNSTTPTAAGVHLGMDTVNYANIELCVNSAGFGASYIDFTAPNYDYRGRVIYFHDNELLAFFTSYGNGSSRYSVYVMDLSNKLNVYGQDSNGYSAAFAGRIVAQGNSFPSDMRIKKNIEQVQANFCLDKVNEMEVVTYDYISKKQNSTTGVLGFISQQIETVDKNCVNNVKQFIPNINQTVNLQVISTGCSSANYIYRFSITGVYTGSVSGNIQLSNSRGSISCEILEYNNNTFTINSKQQLDEIIYCYGTEVDDFKLLNKDRLFAYGIGAIQDLSRQLQITKQDLMETKEELKTTKDALHYLIETIKSSSTFEELKMKL